MNALYQHTLLFGIVCGFSFVAIAWLLLGAILAAVTRRVPDFWLGGSVGAAVVGFLLFLNSIRLGLVEKQLDASLGIAAGAAVAALLAHHVGNRHRARDKNTPRAH